MKKTEAETNEKLKKLSKHIDDINKVETKKRINKKPTFKTTEVVILIVMTTFISLLFGSLVTYNIYSNKLDYSKADDELQTFLETYEEINENYYGEIDKEELINGAISGMLGSLDDYSTYYNESQANNLDITLEGEYEGLGIEIYNNADLDIIIANVIEDSPASEAGLKSGDILIKYNSESLQKMTTTDFIKKVKKDAGKELSLTYIRGETENTVKLKQEQITLKSVTSKTYENNTVGYISLSVFANNAQTQFEEHLKKIEDKKIKSLIIDLRNNSGGHLSTAEDIISMFLDKKHPIYQIESKENTTTYYSRGKNNKEYKIIVLVNQSSASASEILASALKEQYGATLVGIKTYGKGTVQELQSLKNGSKYKLTTKRWLTSKGKQIEGQGIEVDVEVELNEEYKENPIEENDTQLQKALEIAKQ